MLPYGFGSIISEWSGYFNEIAYFCRYVCEYVKLLRFMYMVLCKYIEKTNSLAAPILMFGVLGQKGTYETKRNL
jgi:hypothetical protein